MGSKFRYLADESLDESRRDDLSCALCERSGDVYPFLAKPESLAYPITEACIECIRSMPLGAISPWKSERRVADHLRTVFPEWSAEQVERRRSEICTELRRTPRVPPFWRQDEWPLCCGDIAEYIGGAELEPMTDGLSVFRCASCGRVFEVIQ
jgi:uncharacterized protein CbrC (UPF0167 family)